jgi:hypothetical protein
LRRGLRHHRNHTKGFTPTRRRTAFVLGLATVGVLAVSGIAMATGSSVNFSFAPSNPGSVVKSGRLSFGTHTNYTGMSHVMNRIQLRLDDDFNFNPNSFPKCDPADLSGNITMQAALEACGPAAGAANNAWLWPATANFSNGQATFNLASEGPTACVLVFNGMGSTSELLLFVRMKVDQMAGPMDCGAPTTNVDGDQSFVIQGDLSANPAIGADFTDPDNCSAPDPRRGCQIDLNGVSSGPIRLIHLTASISRGNYVRARCVDPPAGNRQWNLQALFTHTTTSGTTTQTVNASKTCT